MFEFKDSGFAMPCSKCAQETYRIINGDQRWYAICDECESVLVKIWLKLDQKEADDDSVAAAIASAFFYTEQPQEDYADIPVKTDKTTGLPKITVYLLNEAYDNDDDADPIAMNIAYYDSLAFLQIAETISSPDSWLWLSAIHFELGEKRVMMVPAEESNINDSSSYWEITSYNYKGEVVQKYHERFAINGQLHTIAALALSVLITNWEI